MQVSHFQVEATERGGELALAWRNPVANAFPDFQGVRILRRTGTWPTLADLDTPQQIHDLPARPDTPARFLDTGLQGNTVYYYALVAYGQSVPGASLQFGPPVLASRLALTAYQSAEELYRLLPALYRRYDTMLPPSAPTLDPAVQAQGQLRRLLELFGAQFDLLRSYAATMRDFSDVERLDGALLPLLAGWIAWPTNAKLSLARQRNEIRYAPHYYRTLGLAAQLQATIQRVTTWDVRVKEFAHNVFLTNAPAQFFLQETMRPLAKWQVPQLVTLDVAYEGRPAVLALSEGRTLLGYHARQMTSATGSGERADVWCKVHDHTGWLPALRLTAEGDLNKYPTVWQEPRGNLRVVWASYEKKRQFQAQLKQMVFALGRAAQPPQLRSSQRLFKFTEGDEFQITLHTGPTRLTRTVVLRAEHFRNLQQVTATELVALLERELPGVAVALTNTQEITITALSTGANVRLVLPESVVGKQLEFRSVAEGREAARAQLLSRRGPFSLAANRPSVLWIRVDNAPFRLVILRPHFFQNPTQATAQELARVINETLPGVATAEDERLVLRSAVAGAASFIAVDVDSSSAAAALGFGARVPLPRGPGASREETTPSAVTVANGDTWLFWSSRAMGPPQIWYSRFTGQAWEKPVPLTNSSEADSEPAAVFDPVQKKLWVCWTRKKSDGRSNIFFRTTTRIETPLVHTWSEAHPEPGVAALQTVPPDISRRLFPPTIAVADWTAEEELTPLAEAEDRMEPAPVWLGADRVEVFFSSTRSDGWQVWSQVLTPDGMSEAARVPMGNFLCRAPAVLATSQGVRLWVRTNASQVYTSPAYPAAQTIDARYGGATTVDTRNARQLAAPHSPRDAQRYVYDTGRTEADWYARDTLGIYLMPDTDDRAVILQTRNLLTEVVRRVLPIQVRVVFILPELPAVS